MLCLSFVLCRRNSVSPVSLRFRDSVNSPGFMISGSGLDPKSIVCLGISSQRTSFTTWNRKTGKCYHKWEQKWRANAQGKDIAVGTRKSHDRDRCFRFIIWKDQRAATLVKEWNQSIMMKGLRIGSHILYTLMRSKRFLAGSVYKFMNMQVVLLVCSRRYMTMYFRLFHARSIASPRYVDFLGSLMHLQFRRPPWN